jgi:hypothetical protein
MRHVGGLLSALVLWDDLVSHMSLSSAVLVVAGARVHPYEHRSALQIQTVVAD